MAAGSNKLGGATFTCAASRMSSMGTGKRFHAAARSRSWRARSSTARRSSGSRVLSSGLVTGAFPVPHKFEILHQLHLLLRRQVVLGEGGDAAVALMVIALGDNI